MSTNEQMDNAIPTDLPGGMDGVEPNDTEKKWQPLEIPELGIVFRRFYSPRCITLVAAWHNDTDSHIYEIRIMKIGEGQWEATSYNDGLEGFNLFMASKHMCERLACAAMRSYLIRGHRKPWRKERAAAKEVA